MLLLPWFCAALAYHSAMRGKMVAVLDRFHDAQRKFVNTEQNLGLKSQMHPFAL